MTETAQPNRVTIDLTAAELAWLIARSELSCSANSPLTSYIGVEAAGDETSLAARGALEPIADAALEVLADPDVQVRSIIAGASQTRFSVYLGRRRQHPDVLIEFDPHESGARLSYPWRRDDLVAVAGQFVGSAPVAVDSLRLKLSPAGLAAFAASVDVMRERLLSSLLGRDPDLSLSILAPDLEAQVQAGAQSDDGRWVFTALRLLAPVAVPLVGDDVESGVEELVKCELLAVDGPGWLASPLLQELAVQWWSPLPAVAHEFITFDGDTVESVRHQTIVHGAGPLRTFEFHGMTSGEPLISVASSDPVTALDRLATMIQSPHSQSKAAASPSAEPAAGAGGPDEAKDRYCHAAQAVNVHSLDDPTRVVSNLEPRRAYLVRRVADGWVHVADPPSGLEGWVRENDVEMVG